MAKIAIIGASYLQMPAVEAAMRLGHETICFAWPEGAVCKDVADRFYAVSITEKEKILEICRQEGIDGVMTVASDLAVHTVNFVADRLGLVANPFEWTDVTTDKYAMRRCLSRAGVPCPEFHMISDVEKLKDLVLPRFPLIIKPTDRSGSRGITKVNNPAEIAYAVRDAMEEGFSKEVLIEEFVSGREISVESISYKGRHYILQITDKVTTGAPHFVEIAHHQPSDLPESIKCRVREIVNSALTALHVEYGAGHSELIITPEGDIRVVEIGARGGGDFIASDLVRLSTGYDFMEAIVEMALGNFVEPNFNSPACSGVYFLSGVTSGLLPLLKCPPEDIGGCEVVKSEITDSALHGLSCSGDRSGYLIYRGPHRLNLNLE